MKKRITSLGLGIAVPVALLLLTTATGVFSDDHDKKTDITFDKPVQVPGAVLQPGKYMFILLNSISDRHMVEVKSEDGKTLYALTFATRAERLRPTNDAVITFYEMPAGTPDAVREWYWPGDIQGTEFLYAHQTAAEITAATHQTVPEITDEEAATLSSKKTVGDSGNVAESSQQAVQSTSDQSASVQTAPQVPDQSTQQAAVVEQPAPAPQPVQDQLPDNSQSVAQVNPPADNPPANDVIAQNQAPTYTPAPAASTSTANSSNSDNSSLPQTASNLPLVGLIGLVSLVSALSLRLIGRA